MEPAGGTGDADLSDAESLPEAGGMERPEAESGPEKRPGQAFSMLIRIGPGAFAFPKILKGVL